MSLHGMKSYRKIKFIRTRFSNKPNPGDPGIATFVYERLDNFPPDASFAVLREDNEVLNIGIRYTV